MQVILLLTFVTVSLIGWMLVFHKTPDASLALAAQKGERHIARSRRPLDQTLARLHIPLTVSEFRLAIALGGVAAGLVGLAALRDPVMALALGVGVWPLVHADLNRRTKHLAKQVAEQLPDTLMMLTNSLKVGHSLIQAFQTLGEELPAPLGPEFARTTRDLQLGQGLEEALSDFKQRVGSMEIDMMVQAILIQRETGGNLVEILTNLQNMLRERLKLQGKVRTLTAQGKLSGVVIGALPFGLVLFLWVANRPYLMDFVANPLGVQLLVAALFGQLIGILFIRRIVNFPI